MGTRIRRDQIRPEELSDGLINRDESGNIESVVIGENTISFQRDVDNKISEITLPDRVITLVRENGKITGWETSSI